MHNRLPVTPVPDTLRDLAATEPLRTVRKALANAEYQERLDVRAVEASLKRGGRGAAKLRNAVCNLFGRDKNFHFGGGGEHKRTGGHGD